MGKRWVSDPAVAYEGIETSDGRTFDVGAFRWREPPVSLLAQFETQAGHDGATIVGTVEHIGRVGGRIVAAGSFDDSPEASRAVAALQAGSLRRVSVDYASIESDIEIDEDDQGWITAIREQVHVAEIGGLTMVSFSAFADAAIRLDEGESPALVAGAEMLTAADLAAVGPAPEIFDDPNLASLTPLTLADSGRLYGHIAQWGQCHIAHLDACVTAPRSATNYAHFLTGHVICADGSARPTGVLSMGCGHAPAHLGASAAVAHYDNAGTAIADVACGEDDCGIWVSGRIRPGVGTDDVAALLGSSPSGDWRLIGGNLELVAVLAVNVPGFPVPHSRARVAAGECVVLTAAGRVPAASMRVSRELLEGRLRRLGYPPSI